MTDGLTDAVYRGLPDDAIWACIRERRDEVALRAFLHRHGGRLLGCARAVTGDEHAAQDAVQEAMIRLIRDRARLPNHRAAMAWLYVAVDRTARVGRRAERRRKAREEQVSFARPEEASSSDPDTGEIRGVVNRAVADLPARERQAVELVYFEGLTHADAADALGWSRGAVGSYLTRALRRLELRLVRDGVTLGATALAATLSAPTPSMSRTIAAAFAAALRVADAPTVGWVPSAVKVALVMAVCAGLGVAGVGTPETPIRTRPTGVSLESLGAKNERLFYRDVLPDLWHALHGLLPSDNPPRLVAVRTFGPAIECEIASTRPLLPGVGLSAVRGTYCVLRRTLAVTADLYGEDKWKAINLDRPIILDLAVPSLPIPALELGRDRAALARKAFGRLPADDRSEAELTRHLFGPPGTELSLPGGAKVMTAIGGQSVVTTGDRGMFVRTPAAWKYFGECPGWFLAADADRLYCDLDGVRVRPAAGVGENWERWCDRPHENWNEWEVDGMAVAGGRVHYAVRRRRDGAMALWWKPLDDPKAAWVRDSSVPPLRCLTGCGDWLFGIDTGSDGRLMRRSAADPRVVWERIGRMPTDSSGLHAVGDRVFAYNGAKGSIHARPLTGGDVEWKKIGHIRPDAVR